MEDVHLRLASFSGLDAYEADEIMGSLSEDRCGGRGSSLEHAG